MIVIGVDPHKSTHTATAVDRPRTPTSAPASADSDRHRLSRYGDLQLNSAIHTVAI